MRSHILVVSLLMTLAPVLAQAQDVEVPLRQPSDAAQDTKCRQDLQFSDVSYDELKNKLSKTLEEKNKSLIFLDFRTLQAQIDLVANHVLMEENYSTADALDILNKVFVYLEQYEVLLAKAKANAKNIKDDHVVPLATLTSLKADYDKCRGVDSQFPEIFKHLSQLNKDLNEILMMSPQKILAQKDTVKNLIQKVEDNKVLSSKSVALSLNFIQGQINTVTHAFQFDVKTLNIAKAL